MRTLVYTVLNDFSEKHHNNTVYRKGETYPKDDFKAKQDRVTFLQEVHPVYGVPFLEKPVEKIDETIKNEAPQPKKTSKRTQKNGDK